MTKQDVLDRLKTVNDPEIPGLSIVDLGMVIAVAVQDDSIQVTLRPTYLGCPALDWIRAAVERALRPMAASVQYNMTDLWSATDITVDGRASLKAFGIAPANEDRPVIECPQCGSEETHMTSPFGSARCRTIYYCDTCRQPFEAWKKERR